MPSFKIDRTTEDIHRELTAILREVKDPRVKDCLLSLVRVEVTNDLSYCTVYVSTMEGLERSKTAVQGLKSAAGFIRRELGRRLSEKLGFAYYDQEIIQEIARRCGYTDQHYFSYCFKKYCGESPNALRRKLRPERAGEAQ